MITILRRFAPWLILGITALACSLAVYIYGLSVGFFGVGQVLPALAETPPVTPAAPPPHQEQPVQQKQPDEPQAVLPQELRGVWIATVLNIDFPKAKGDAEAQKQELREILDTAKATGLNTVFFQVRPKGDALYASKIFPWSEYLTGQAGQDPGYDPLAFMLEEAHQRGLAVHAWVNPYRLSMGSKDKPESLPPGSPVQSHPELVMRADDGRLYLNPGEPEAGSLVLAGIREIFDNYQVDGIHLDDYFYPGSPGYDDSAAFKKYGGGLNLADWRRGNTRSLIKQIQALVREVRPQAAFGVSPSGIWQNNKNSPLGSATNGFESYAQIYADTRGWVKEGLMDYIIPQLYWAIGKEGSDYAVLARWWRDVCQDSGVKLYIGHGAYRLGESKEEAWQSAGEIVRQLKLNKELGIGGSAFYGYRQIHDNTLGLQDSLKLWYTPQ